MKARPFRSKLLLPVLLITSSHLEATTLTWNGTAGGNWNTTATNWLDELSVATAWSNSNPDAAIFGATGAGTVNLTTGITAIGLTFNTTGYSIEGNSLALSGGTPTITTATGVTATIKSGIAGGGVLTKTGAGTLVLSSAKSYSGGTNITEGALALVQAGGQGTTITAAGTSGTTIAVGNSTTLSLDATGASGYQLFGYSLTGAGAFSLLGSSNQRVIMTGANGSSSGFTGNISVTANSILETRGVFSATTGNNIDVAGTLFIWDGGNTTSFGALTGGGTINTVTGGGGGNLNIGKSNTDGTFSGVISNSNGPTLALVKTGTGTQTLSGSNIHTGATNINGGTLKAGAINTFSSGSAITLANTSGVSLDLAGFNQTVGSIAGGGAAGGNITLGSGTLTSGGNNTTTSFGGVISGLNGALLKTGSGTLTLSGNNTYSGGTTISKGTLTLGHTAGAGAGTITLNDANTDVANTTLTLAAGTYGNAITVANQGMGTSTISTASTSGSLSLNGGLTLNKNATLSTAGLASWLSMESSGTLFSGSGTLTIDSASASNYALILNTGTSTGFTGNVVVNANAKLEARNLLNPNGTTKVAGNNMQVNGWLYLSGGANSTTVNALTGSGNIGTRWNGQSTLTVGQGDGSGGFSGVIQNGTPPGSQSTAFTKIGIGIQTLSGANTYTGNTTISAGTLEIGGSGKLGDANNIYAGNITNNAAFVYSSSAAQTLSGVISGSGSLAKQTGNSILTLGGNNSYTGATTVNSGTLVINGNQSAATGAVTVSNAGTRLMGSGTVGGSTTINSGAIHAPGNSPGVQSFSNDLTYSSGSIFEWDLANSADAATTDTRGTDYDGVNVSGTLAGDDTIFRVVLNAGSFEDTFWDDDRSWNDVFTATNGINSKDYQAIFDTVQWYQGGTNMTAATATRGSFSISGSSLNWTAVPEPSGALAALLAGAGLLRRRRIR